MKTNNTNPSIETTEKPKLVPYPKCLDCGVTYLGEHHCDEPAKERWNKKHPTTKEVKAVCNFCGHPMPKGEEMFKFHGYSGDCPSPPLVTNKTTMEERYYKVFGCNDDWDSSLFENTPVGYVNANKKVLDFIRSEISQAIKVRDQQWIEAVEKIKVAVEYHPRPDDSELVKAILTAKGDADKVNIDQVLDTMGVEQ